MLFPFAMITKPSKSDKKKPCPKNSIENFNSDWAAISNYSSRVVFPQKMFRLVQLCFQYIFSFGRGCYTAILAVAANRSRIKYYSDLSLFIFCSIQKQNTNIGQRTLLLLRHEFNHRYIDFWKTKTSFNSK